MRKKGFVSIKSEYITDKDPIFLNFFEQKQSDDCWHQYHDTYELGICLKGNGVFFIENKSTAFSQGSIYVICPGDYHHASSTNENPSEWAFIFFDAKDIGIKNIIKKSIHFYEKDSFKLVEVLIDELDKKQSGYTERATLIIDALFSRISSVIYQEDESLHNINTLSSVSPAINFITDNYKKNISIKELANLCHFTTDYFRHIFKVNMGVSPQKYINNYKITIAEQLLIFSDIPITNISYEVGFTSTSTFNRTFKSKNGISPKDFRIIHKG